MKNKTLYCNGKVVCKYESTGNDIQDMEKCTEILKEKGLYEEISNVDRMFGQDNSFVNTAKQIYEKDLRITPCNGSSLAPFIVNAAFGIEIYLKTIHKILGQDKRGHDLLQLYKGLSEDAKEVI